MDISPLDTHPLRSRLEEALAHGGGTHSLEDVSAAIDGGTAQLWETPGALLVTEVNVGPRAKELHFWLAAGELEAVLALSEVVMDWGREIGCQTATLTGRKGWARVMARRGWDSHLVVMGRML